MYKLTFWNSIWLLYYLKFVNNQQIGTIELIVFFTAQIFEIPTGFIGDKVGWKKSVLFGLPFLAIGNIVMGAIPSFNAFLVSGLIMGIGDAFYQEAFSHCNITQQNQKVMTLVNFKRR